MNPTPAASVLIYEAERIPGPDGAVERTDTPITEAAAITLIQAGNDIVVCGPNRRDNRNKARELTILASGGFEGEELHDGRMALYHFHPLQRTPDETHIFFESPPRHARKKK